MAKRLPLIVRMGMIKRLPSLSPSQFSEHWRGPHGAIASRIPNLRRYHQNHAIEALQLAGLPDRWRLDGLSELWFDDIDSMMAAIRSPDYAPLAQDTPTVMTMPGLIAGLQEQVFEDAGDRSRLAKAMILAGRNTRHSATSFVEEWRDRSETLRNLPMLRAVVNSYITHWEGRPGEKTRYESLPIDLVVELWFASLGALRSAFESKLDGFLGSKPQELIVNASCYAVQNYAILAS